jgi:glycosyltransferase involved in cell wall biosynthesis
MKLLIVSLDAYSLFDTSTHFLFGGAELRSSLFAKEFSKMPGVEVTFVTRDQGKKKKKFQNILVVPHPKKKGQGYWEEQRKIGTRIKNKLAIKKSMDTSTFFFDELSPTHVLVLGMNPETVEFWNYSKKAGIPFVFGCASDLDLSENFLSPNSPKDASGNDASEYANVIRSASAVLVQSRFQEEMLLERFGRKGVLISSPVSTIYPTDVPDTISKSDVLWVGRTSPFKRPELVLEIAKALPDIKFRMILNNLDAEQWNKIVKGKSSNIEIIESVSIHDIEYYFMQTKVFLNTSITEGFPNTFLQAGKFGVPFIGTDIDPRKFLLEKTPTVVTDLRLSTIIHAIETLVTNESERKKSAEEMREYIMKNHAANVVAKKLFEEISKLNPPI